MNANGSEPYSPAATGRTPRRGDPRCAVRWFLSPHPSLLSWRAGHYPQDVLPDTGAVLSAWEDRCFAVPKGQARIAQRFNAGFDVKRWRVPKGRLRSNPIPHPSAIPSGLVCHAGCFPALKRRAILKTSLRDKGTWRPPFPPSKQPDSLAMPPRAFRGHGVQPRRCGTRSSWREGEPFSVAAGILPAVEPGILPGGMGVWFEKSPLLRTSGPGGKMPPSTAAKMAAATDVNRTLTTYQEVEPFPDPILDALVAASTNSRSFA
jgi:hypothetical protein